MIRTAIEGDMRKTWSDAGFMIHGGFPEGNYEEAYDPVESVRTYTETDIPIPDEDLTPEEIAAAIEEVI